MSPVFYLFLIVAGSPVAHVGTFSNGNSCLEAAAGATREAQSQPPKGVGAAPGWVLLCVPANDAKSTPPRN
jgi:hypothetical protein